MGRINGKNKGNRNERQLAKALKEWSGYEFTKVPMSGGLRWKRTADTSGDIILSDNNHPGPFPFSIETKFHQEIKFEHLLLNNKNTDIIKFWEQAMGDANRANKIPIVFMRYNSMPASTWFVVVSFKFYKQVLGKIDKKLIFTDKNHLVIFYSPDLFSTKSYKKILKKSQLWLKKQK